MRSVCFAIVIVVMASGPVFAQPAAQPITNGQPITSGQSPQKPIDNGPNTPQANSAYQGGGVVLQGAPGAPAPTPQPTPPGQTPKNAVQP